MRINKIQLHNFRAIKDGIFNLNNYSLLIGENNSGKSTVITAIRMFYEDDGLKFNDARDFPKFKTEDITSWIEIEFQLTDDESSNLKDEYRIEGNKLKVRRYFKSENKELVDSKNSNIYAYENGNLSSNYFYGAKNISQTKLGKVIFIPEISKTSDTLKFSGPSPLRDITNFVFSKIVKNSPSYSALNSAFDSFNEEFDKESKSDDFTLNSLQTDINYDLKSWEVSFGLRINPIKPADIVKTLFSHYITDNNLGDKEVDIASLGQGVQRHLIYTLLKLTAKYVDKKEEKKKDFSPNFTLILFEEPEAFLHPTQQEQLNISLSKVSSENQILISTHSPIFVSKNIDNLTSIVKLDRANGIAKIFQIEKSELDDLLNSNAGLYKHLSDLLGDTTISDALKKEIRKKHLGDDVPDMPAKLYDESFKYFLWLDSERSSAFFAKHVIICEGATEKIFLDFLINTKWNDLKGRQMYFLDSLGKFNIHRFMNLFGKLGITHSVLFDSDNDKGVHDKINGFIENNKNSFTKKIQSFDKDFEAFLNISLPSRNDLKPLNIMTKYDANDIEDEKISELKKLIEEIL